MGDMVLLAAMAAVMVLGWFLMGKLDRFLAGNRRGQDVQPPPGGDSLRLGFCDPTVADSLADVLEQYSKLYPDVPIRLFCGGEGELLEGLTAGKVDAAFLPEDTAAPAHYRSMGMTLERTPVLLGHGGLEVAPIAEGSAAQNALWIDGAEALPLRRFVECLQGGFGAPARGHGNCPRHVL